MSKNIIHGIPELSKQSKGIILFALALLFFFNNGDTILLSTAAPTILADIGGLEVYALIFSVKMLTNAVCMMLCGKLSDKLGRRNIILMGVLFVLVGYLGSGFSANITMMIVFRAITGCGSGFSLGLAYTMLGDLFSGKAHSTAYTVSIVAQAVAMVGGPILGGVLVTHLPWQWAFWILVPLAIISFILIFLKVPNYRFDSEQVRMDTRGMILYTAGMTILLTLLSTAGTFWKWASVKSLIMIIAFAVLFILFAVNEHKTDERSAILPVKLLSNRVIVGSACGQLCMTLNSLCLMTYIPYYMQGAMGISSVSSGYTLAMIYSVCTIGGVIILRKIGTTQKYRFWGRFTVYGEGIALVLLLIFLKPTMSPVVLNVILFIYAAMASIESSAFIMTVQASLGPKRMGAGTSIITFVQAFASVLGTAVGGAILNTSADFAGGMYNVFIFAAIITVIGAILYTVIMPKNSEILRIREQEIEKEKSLE